jgi:Lrp/AsnC family leucine-responsive transcriptional regulator
MAALDALDHSIIEILRRDARTSSRSIARQLGVSAGSVGQRVTRLEDNGVITGYCAVVDETQLGRRLAFVVGLQMSQSNAMDSVR